MKVSILVPVYGVEKYIARCAESLFGQTHEDMEYIFVDDCTPDRSISILRSVMERFPERQGQVRIISHAVNQGVGAARATALAEASGDCLMHADSDDYMPTNAVELLCRKMEETDADIVDGAWRRVTAEGVQEKHIPCQTTDTKAYLCMVLCQNVVSNRLWGRLFKRSLYADNGITFASGVDYSEDWPVMARLLFHAKRAFINDTVYFYSDENGASYTHNVSRKHVISYIKANRIVADFFKVHDKAGRYLTPLQIGLVNMLRNARKAGISEAEVNSLCPYKPQGTLFRLIAAMMRNHIFPLKVAEAIYLAERRAYIELRIKRMCYYELHSHVIMNYELRIMN